MFCRKTCTYLSRWLYFTFMLAAIVLSCISVASCRFVYVIDPDDASADSTAAGLYRSFDEDEETCGTYDSSQTWDSSEKGARMGGVVAPILAVIAMGTVLIESCCCACYVRFGRWIVLFCLVLAQVFQGLTFMWFNSSVCGSDWVREITDQTPCTIGEGAASSITATVFYFVSALLLKFTPPPYQKNSKDGEEDKTAQTGKRDENGILA